MVGNVPFFKFLFMPFIGKASVKQSLVKYSEHTANFPTVLKSFRWMDTNLFHFNLTLPESGEFIVLYVSTVLNNTTSTRHTFALSQKSEERTSKSFQKYLVLHAKLATFVCLVFLRWCFYVTSRPNFFKYYSRSFFESSNGGKTFTKIAVQINTLPDHIWTPNLAR